MTKLTTKFETLNDLYQYKKFLDKVKPTKKDKEKKSGGKIIVKS